MNAKCMYLTAKTTIPYGGDEILDYCKLQDRICEGQCPCDSYEEEDA